MNKRERKQLYKQIHFAAFELAKDSVDRILRDKQSYINVDGLPSDENGGLSIRYLSVAEAILNYTFISEGDSRLPEMSKNHSPHLNLLIKLEEEIRKPPAYLANKNKGIEE